MDAKPLVLEIGPNVKPQAQLIWPDAQIMTMDVLEELKPDIVANAFEPHPELHGKFDAILASHVLEHVSYWGVLPTLQEWRRWLTPGGQLHIIVPSLEWAARQILAEQTSPALWPHLYAGQTNPYDIHLGGFTLRFLRYVIETAGFEVRAAKTGPYKLLVQGVEHGAEQHYVAAIKAEE